MMPGPAWKSTASIAIAASFSRSTGASDGSSWRARRDDVAGFAAPRCPSFAFETLSSEDWVGRRMLADRFRDRRVFLCGDAAHLGPFRRVPEMNAGAGGRHPWAGPCSTRTVWRRPPTKCRAAETHDDMGNALRPRPQCDRGAPSAVLRTRIGHDRGHVLHDGYFCEGSPIIAYDGEASITHTEFADTVRAAPASG